MIAAIRIIITCLMLLCNDTLLFSQKVFEDYANIESFQCSFVEHKMIKSLNESFISEGTIKYTQTEIIFEYTKPEHIVIRKNADDIITVSKNDKSIKTNMFHKQTISFVENILKGNIANLTDNYQIVTTDDADQNIVGLTAKKKSRVETVELYFDKSDSNVINKIIVRETKGNVTTITVSDLKIIM